LRYFQESGTLSGGSDKDEFAAAVAKSLWLIDQARGIRRENVRKDAAPDRRVAPADQVNQRRANAQIEEGDGGPS